MGKIAEGCDKRVVALVRVAKEAVMSCSFLGFLPGTFGRVVVGLLGREAEQLYAVMVEAKPGFPLWFQVVARAIVKNQEYLSTRGFDELLEEGEKSGAIEYLCELVFKTGRWLDRNSPEHVSCLAHAKRIDVRLNTTPRPSSVKTAIEPETGLVAKHHDAAAAERFFLIAG